MSLKIPLYSGDVPEKFLIKQYEHWCMSLECQFFGCAALEELVQVAMMV